MVSPRAGAPTLRWPWLQINWAQLPTPLILIALIAADVIVQPALLDVNQIGLEMQTALPLIFVGFAQTLAALARGIDLSVGGIMIVANVLTATWVGGDATGHLARLPVLLLLGAIMGSVNGISVAYLDFEPFIATLATWAVYNGIALLVLPTDGGVVPQALVNGLTGNVGPIPDAYLILAAVLVLWWYLKGTRLGHSIYAVGSDEERARLNGVGVRRVKVAVYALAGLAAAVGGIVLAATTSTGTPTAGDGYILPSVAAVVIGGTKLTGGRGGVGLTIMGAFILTLINDLVTALHFAPYVSVLAASALLLVVVGGQAVVEVRAAKEET